MAEAARVMDRQQVTCLLVTDENSKLLGMLSPRDLLRAFLRPAIDDTRLPVAASLTDY
jgi:predicted transcriptional regulator